MRCVKCGSTETSVLDSRGDGDAIRRRRVCEACGFRFTTYERVELALPAIVKKDGRREAFDRSKLKAGIARACEKRPVSVEMVDQIVDNVERRTHELLAEEVPSRHIGDLVMEELRNVDQIAYVRFASVYREFTDVNQFVSALQSLAENEDSEGQETVLPTGEGNVGA